MKKCTVCHFPRGANFCGNCGHLTEHGKKVDASSPDCACGGREPRAKVDGWMYPDEFGDIGLTQHPDGSLDTPIYEGWQIRSDDDVETIPVHMLIFAATEGAKE